ncbi:trans-sulfuration enzyme family protein [Coralliovum pocilloporae]|uniref:trans-sulfuration enzyme family protein n=1 Tax=Coralliovum pocilloporae TaxID=3066369 RepID=UPI0033075EFE
MARKLDIKSAGPQTLAVHGGEKPDTTTGASSPSIVMSSTFLTDGPEEFSAYGMTEDTPYLYTRWANPTVNALEAKIAAFEGAEACQCFASGMAAASAIFLSLLKAGDHVIVADVCYAAIAELSRDILPRFGIEVSYVNLSDEDAFRSALRDTTRLVFIDTPSNPIIRLTDIRAISRLAHEAGALVAVDNTFATPVGTRPLELGADLVMHSATKYLCGHGDAMGGAVAGSKKLIQILQGDAAIHYGGVMSPFNAWLIARGAATLPIRMRAHQETALAVAKFLENHPKIERVFYPGLPSHPQYELARQQMANFSAMMSFRIRGNAKDGRALAHRLAEKLDIIHYAVSLGHHRSLLCWMQTDELLASSFRVDGKAEDSYRHFAGDGIFRFSVGLEDADDLCKDLDRAL